MKKQPVRMGSISKHSGPLEPSTRQFRFVLGEMQAHYWMHPAPVDYPELSNCEHLRPRSTLSTRVLARGLGKLVGPITFPVVMPMQFHFVITRDKSLVRVFRSLLDSFTRQVDKNL